MQANSSITYRSLGKMVFFLIITLGLYLLYWLVATKNQFNRLGASIPTAWLLIVPIGNFYFFYKFAQGFVYYILEQKTEVISYFLLIALLPFVGMFIYQSHCNDKSALSTRGF